MHKNGLHTAHLPGGLHLALLSGPLRRLKWEGGVRLRSLDSSLDGLYSDLLSPVALSLALSGPIRSILALTRSDRYSSEFRQVELVPVMGNSCLLA